MFRQILKALPGAEPTSKLHSAKAPLSSPDRLPLRLCAVPHGSPALAPGSSVHDRQWGALQIDARCGISLAACRQQNCKCWLLLWHTPQTALHRCLRRPKQGCSWPEVVAQRALAAPDCSQLPHAGGVNFSVTFRTPAHQSPPVGKLCLYCVPHFMNEEAVLQVKELIFFPKIKSKYDRVRTERKKREIE